MVISIMVAIPFSRWEVKFGEVDRPTRIQIAPALRQP